MKHRYVIEKRSEVSVWLNLAAILVAMIIGLLISAVLIRSAGANVLDAYKALVAGAFGTKEATLETMVQATPLLFTGLAMLISFRSKVINLGAEGQFLAGAMAAAWISMTLSSLPQAISAPVIVVGSMLAGAAWAYIPAILKVKLDTSEVLSTVLLNYVILYGLSFLLSGPWRPPNEFLLQTVRFPENTNWPTFFQSRLHLGFFLGIGLAALIYYVIWKTPFGYELRAVGENPTASKYKGIKVARTMVLAMILSGALAGLAGAGEVSGVQHRLRLDISKGYGWTGILIALLGQLNPVGVIISAIFFGGLINGSTSMKIQTGVPIALVESVQGIVLFTLLAAQAMIQYRIRRVANAEPGL